MHGSKKECVVICNGPSVIKLSTVRNLGFDLSSKFIIAVNRWLRVFDILSLPNPNAVVVGAQSLPANSNLIGKFPTIDFYLHSERDAQIYPDFSNVKTTPKGVQQISGNNIFFDATLWWSGTFQIQLALSMGFEKIHIFGFSCTDEPDYADTFNREPIPFGGQSRIEHFFNSLVKAGLDNRLFIYEESPSWRFNSSIGHRRTSEFQLGIEKFSRATGKCIPELQNTNPNSTGESEKWG